MPVAALVLGILGFVVFSWLGPLLGVLWATQVNLSPILEGAGLEPQIVTWPVWAAGLTLGVGVPMIAVVLGAVALRQPESKGVALGGIVTGAIGALAGFVLIFVFQTVASLGQAAIDNVKNDDQFNQNMQQLQQQLNDPALQQQIQDQLNKAMQQQQGIQPAGQPPTVPIQPQPAEQETNPEQPAPEEPAAGQDQPQPKKQKPQPVLM